MTDADILSFQKEMEDMDIPALFEKVNAWRKEEK